MSSEQKANVSNPPSYQKSSSLSHDDINEEGEKVKLMIHPATGKKNGEEGTNSSALQKAQLGMQTHLSLDDEDNGDHHFRMNDYRTYHVSLLWKKFGVLGCIIMLLLVGILLVALVEEERKGATFQGNGSSTESPSCGKSFEPNPIMALKESSTIEDVQTGAVSSDHPLCSKIGLSILQDHNGNAVDAAVATTLCLGVANPASSGIGGGAFLLIHSDMASHETKASHEHYQSPKFIDARDGDDKHSNGKITEVIDCREVAPSRATTEMYVNITHEFPSVYGGLAIGIPGELRGLELAHARHGRLPWKDVVQPAVKLARDGVVVTPHLASDIAHHSSAKRKNSDAEFSELFKLLSKNHDGSTLLEEGDILTNPALADTLEAVSNQGANALYEGRAKQMAQEIQEAGGIITEDDIRNYRPTLRSPVIGRNVNGFNIIGAPPPSSGGATLIGAARFLAGYQTPLASFADTLSQHRITEATRHAFAIRMSLSDPNYNSDAVRDAVNDLVSSPHMESLRQITKDNETLPLSQYGGKRWAQLRDTDGQSEAKDAHEGDRRRLNSRQQLSRRFGYLEDHGTSHLSIVDKDGNAVSLTSTINLYFGSHVVSPSTGVIFNDQMDDFSLPGLTNFYGLKPSEANYIKPGKKPLSSMSPTMIFAQHEETKTESLGDLFMVLGASGGPKIITAVLSAFINYAHLGKPLFESMAHPRLHDQLLYHGSSVTTYEKCPLEKGPTIQFTDRTVSALKKRGHRVIAIDYTGCVQAVAVDLETKRLTAVADIRKGGMPAGY